MPSKSIQERRAERRQALRQMIFTIFQSISIFVSMITNYYRNLDTQMMFRPFNLLLLVLTIVFYTLWCVAKFQLGVAITVFPSADKPLVTTGLYSVFSSPIYLFGTLAFISYVLLLKWYKLLFLLIVLVPVQFVRALLEKKVLKKKYGDQYVSYSKKLIF